MKVTFKTEWVRKGQGDEVMCEQRPEGKKRAGT